MTAYFFIFDAVDNICDKLFVDVGRFEDVTEGKTYAFHNNVDKYFYIELEYDNAKVPQNMTVYKVSVNENNLVNYKNLDNSKLVKKIKILKQLF